MPSERGVTGGDADRRGDTDCLRPSSSRAASLAAAAAVAADAAAARLCHEVPRLPANLICAAARLLGVPPDVGPLDDALNRRDDKARLDGRRDDLSRPTPTPLGAGRGSADESPAPPLVNCVRSDETRDASPSPALPSARTCEEGARREA